MEQNQYPIDDLLAKWLAGEANNAEIDWLNNWAEKNEDNKQYVQQFETLWNSAQEQIETKTTEQAWQKVMAQTVSVPANQNRFTVVYKATAWIAASLALLLGIQWYMQPQAPVPSPMVAANVGLFIQSGDGNDTAFLADHTQVILMPHSSITADTGYGKTHRRLRLTGKAWFQTEHGHLMPFIVSNGQVTVRDIGTAFWVNGDGKNTTVSVTQGQVMVSTTTDSSLLNLGDSAIIFQLQEKIKLITQKTAEKIHEIQNKILVFNKTELKTVTELLNSTYNANIRLGNQGIASCKFTASFNNENLETVLDVIRDTFNLEIRREGSVIYLDGKGCQ